MTGILSHGAPTLLGDRPRLRQLSDWLLYVFHQGEGDDGRLWFTSTADGETGPGHPGTAGRHVSQPGRGGWIGVPLPQ